MRVGRNRYAVYRRDSKTLKGVRTPGESGREQAASSGSDKQIIASGFTLQHSRPERNSLSVPLKGQPDSSSLLNTSRPRGNTRPASFKRERDSQL